MTKPHMLTFDTYETWDIGPMESEYVLHQIPDSGQVSDLSEEVRNQIKAIAFKGHSYLSSEMIDALPNLEIIANYGVGYDTIDVPHATTKGIPVTNTPDVLTDDVADLAVGLVIAKSRDIVGAAKYVTSGDWAEKGNYLLQTKVSGKKVGIVGLGRIGRSVAERLQPFNMDIHYYARSAKITPGWTHHDDICAMANIVDILIICLSGGPDTKGMVDKAALEALGSEGLLVNVSRGTTVDEEALLDALENRTIAGAALDVFLKEPNINPRFLKLDNVLLQPHQSSGTVETRKVMGQLQRDNLAAHFAGKPLLTQVN
ncbi:MAG: 2-hydroxyacid dehydrogenase [Rhizobiaceae bacterium]|nr:2-hydroxyacid dehydrogenase [Rhizobiaceae bacterium]